MSKPRFGLDLDGVVYKWDRTARYMLKLYLGEDLPPDSDSWNAIEESVPGWKWKWLWTEGVKRGLFRYGHCYKGAIEGVQRLGELTELVVITSRPKSAVQDTLDWLSYNRFPVAEVHILGPDQKKSDVLPVCDFYLDDGLHNMQDLAVNTAAELLLWNRPWNQDGYLEEMIPGCVRRVSTWPEVIEAVSPVRSVA